MDQSPPPAPEALELKKSNMTKQKPQSSFAGVPMTNGKTVLDIPLIQQGTLTIGQYMMNMKIYLKQRLSLSFIHSHPENKVYKASKIVIYCVRTKDIILN